MFWETFSFQIWLNENEIEIPFNYNHYGGSQTSKGFNSKNHTDFYDENFSRIFTTSRNLKSPFSLMFFLRTSHCNLSHSFSVCCLRNENCEKWLFTKQQRNSDRTCYAKRKLEQREEKAHNAWIIVGVKKWHKQCELIYPFILATHL